MVLDRHESLQRFGEGFLVHAMGRLQAPDQHTPSVAFCTAAPAMPTVFPEAVELPNGPLRVSQLALLQEGYAAGRAWLRAELRAQLRAELRQTTRWPSPICCSPWFCPSLSWRSFGTSSRRQEMHHQEAARRMGDDDAIELEEGFLLASPFALELPRVPLEAASAASPASPASSASSASPATPVSAVPTLALPAEVQEGTLGTLSSGMTWRGRAPGAATAPLSQHGGPGVEIFHVLEPALRIQSPASNSRRSRWQLYLLKAARWRTFGLQYAAHVKAGCCWQHGPQLTIFGGKVVSEGVHELPGVSGRSTRRQRASHCALSGGFGGSVASPKNALQRLEKHLKGPALS
eukprot:s8604_g2.t4